MFDVVCRVLSVGSHYVVLGTRFFFFFIFVVVGVNKRHKILYVKPYSLPSPPPPPPPPPPLLPLLSNGRETSHKFIFLFKKLWRRNFQSNPIRWNWVEKEEKGGRVFVGFSLATDLHNSVCVCVPREPRYYQTKKGFFFFFCSVSLPPSLHPPSFSHFTTVNTQEAKKGFFLTH